MNIMDEYKQLQMIENVKKIKEMELCYKSNLKLCKYQGQQINKLANCIEEIKEIAEVLITTTNEYDSCYYKDKCDKCEIKEDCQYIKVEQILQIISEVEK